MKIGNIESTKDFKLEILEQILIKHNFKDAKIIQEKINRLRKAPVGHKETYKNGYIVKVDTNKYNLVIRKAKYVI